MSRPALELLLLCLRLTMTEAAREWGVPLTTLSGLAQGDCGASIVTVRAIGDHVGDSHMQALFPELAGFGAPTPVTV